VKVTDLAHGEQRQLEIAMVLATGPTMLLLDEPMAGMGQAESRRMMEILKPLKGEVSILLIEHDMDVVFALADVVTVLVKGRAVATGAPDAIRADVAVRRAYLGDY
jgi:branched-chain amino acid transport system ATP-binding protein